MRRFSNDPLRRTSSTGFGLELCARFEALHFMRSVVRTKKWIAQSEAPITRYLWTIYFMCIESDGKNGLQLGGYGKLSDFLQICMEELLLPVAHSEQYLLETLDRTLVAWIMWMSTTWGKPILSSPYLAYLIYFLNRVVEAGDKNSRGSYRQSHSSYCLWKFSGMPPPFH